MGREARRREIGFMVSHVVYFYFSLLDVGQGQHLVRFTLDVLLTTSTVKFYILSK